MRRLFIRIAPVRSSQLLNEKNYITEVINMKNQEIWIDIKGYEGKYKVSN